MTSEPTHLQFCSNGEVRRSVQISIMIYRHHSGFSSDLHIDASLPRGSTAPVTLALQRNSANFHGILRNTINGAAPIPGTGLWMGCT
jgi:hypothetical protein